MGGGGGTQIKRHQGATINRISLKNYGREIHTETDRHKWILTQTAK
jgi:hypothetical protein